MIVRDILIWVTHELIGRLHEKLVLVVVGVNHCWSVPGWWCDYFQTAAGADRGWAQLLVCTGVAFAFSTGCRWWLELGVAVGDNRGCVDEMDCRWKLSPALLPVNPGWCRRFVKSKWAYSMHVRDAHTRCTYSKHRFNICTSDMYAANY